MREIRFRGKRVDNGEWVYGSLSWGFSIHRQSQYRTIVFPVGCNCIEVHEVDPATVGQYTGLRDRKRTEKHPEGQGMFEGDFIEAPRYNPAYVSEEEGKLKNRFEVYWDEAMGAFGLRPNPYEDHYFLSDLNDKAEVVGNVFEES